MKALVIVCAFIMGCASAHKNLQELDVSRAMIPMEAAETIVTIDGPSGKGGGAVVGGAKGAGVGVGTAAVVCIASGPMYPFCLAGGSMLFGGVGTFLGAGYGAATAEYSDKVKEKQAMLIDALMALEANQNLAPLVYKKSLESTTLKLSPKDKTSLTADPEWTLRIALDEFSTDGSGPDGPYSLLLSARVEIIRPGENKPAYSKAYQANSPVPMITAKWRANNDEPVRSALNDLLATLATEISNDLKPIQLRLGKPVEDYKVHLQPVSTEMKTELIPVIETSQSPSPVKKGTYNPNQNNLFDTTTGVNWIIVDSNPVDLSTANTICASLETGDKKRYKVPSLLEFEDLWEKYKNNEHIRIFKKREYCTDGKHNFTRSAYVQTFSFASGSEGLPSQLNAAYLTCVSKKKDGVNK